MPKPVRKQFLILALTCLFVALVVAFIVPNLLRWRFAQGEHSVTGEIHAIDEAVKAYTAEHGATPPTLSSLKGRITPALSCDASGCESIGYHFQYAASAGSKPHYTITAEPVSPSTGIYSYYLDETGVLRRTKENRPATSSDPPVDGTK